MLDAICNAREGGINRVLCKAPTGTGKTQCFSHMLRWPALAAWLDTMPTRGARMLVIAHREELLDQAADKIWKANPGLIVDIEQGARRAHRFSDVVVASIQTLSALKFKRLQRLLLQHTFRIVIVDEAHHAAAGTYRGALVYLGFLPPALNPSWPNGEGIDGADVTDAGELERQLAGWDKIAPRDRLLVGVTATPNRSDAIGLGCVFQTIGYSYGLKAAIEDKWLVPITPWVVETSQSLDHVGLNHGDFNQRQLADTVNTAARNNLAVKAWQDYAAGLSTIAFTVDVAHAQALAGAFNAAGARAAAVSGETPKDERRAILAAYSGGELDIVTNCMVLTEGVDLPRTGCILHAKPTKSATLYEQMTGRGLRLFPGKADCVVIDMVDVARRHSLQTAPVLYGLPPGVNANGKRLGQVEADVNEFLAKYPGFDMSGGTWTLEQLQVKASTFDVWAVPELGAFGNGRALNWIKSGADEFRLNYPWADGTETLVVAPDLLGHYDVSCTLKPSGGGAVRQRTIASQILTADAAAGLAEAFVLQERRSVMKMKDKDATWRVDAPSDKQLALLRRLRAPIRPGLTRGEASDLIDVAMARKSGRR